MGGPLRALLLAAALGLATLGHITRPMPDWQFATPARPDPSLPPSVETVYSVARPGSASRAPALIPGGPDGDLALLWQEGARMVGVTLPEGGAPVTAVAPADLGADMVPAQTILAVHGAVDDRAGGLFASTGTQGGPRDRSITHLPGQGGQIAEGRRLDLSPLLGRGHSVVAPALGMAQSGQALPVSVRIAGQHGALVRLDAGGRVRALSEMRGGGAARLGALVPLSGTDAVALLVRNETLVLRRTTDGGQSWTAPEVPEGPGRVAAVTALPINDGQVLAVLRDATSGALSLVTSADAGRSWRAGPVLGADGRLGVTEPVLAVLGDGRLALGHAASDGGAVALHIFTESWAVQQ